DLAGTGGADSRAGAGRFHFKPHILALDFLPESALGWSRVLAGGLSHPGAAAGFAPSIRLARLRTRWRGAVQPDVGRRAAQLARRVVVGCGRVDRHWRHAARP